jgi:hypothetical protein
MIVNMLAQAGAKAVNKGNSADVQNSRVQISSTSAAALQALDSL